MALILEDYVVNGLYIAVFCTGCRGYSLDIYIHTSSDAGVRYRLEGWSDPDERSDGGSQEKHPPVARLLVQHIDPKRTIGLLGLLQLGEIPKGEESAVQAIITSIINSASTHNISDSKDFVQNVIGALQVGTTFACDGYDELSEEIHDFVERNKHSVHDPNIPRPIEESMVCRFA